MLDAIESLAIIREWPTLRLDGSVLSEKRLSLVDRFNRSSDPSLVFLLSSKAGGVGLNL
jgi:SNF2 family DNA or RNA helicase